MVDVPQIPQETIDAAVDEALSRVLPADLGDKPHLARAVIAQRLSAVANHRSKTEAIAAREEDGMSWDDVAHAFGLSVQNARQHFRAEPFGLPG